MTRKSSVAFFEKGAGVVIVSPENRAWFLTDPCGKRIWGLSNKCSPQNIAKKTGLPLEAVCGFLKEARKTLYTPPKVSDRKQAGCSVHVTDDCNFRCVYCRYSCRTRRDDLSLNTIFEFIQSAAEENLKTLTITGGEPLLKWGLCRQIIEEGNRRNLKVSLLTNGALITPQIAKFLGEKGVEVQVSLDTIDLEIFRFLRGNTFEEVISGIRHLVSQGVTVIISCLINKKNIDSVEELINFTCKEGIKGIHFPLLEKGGRAEACWEDLDVSVEELKKCFEKLLTWYFEGGLRKKIKVYDFENIMARIVRPTAANWCRCGRNVSTLYVDGKVYACTNLVGQKQFCLGSVKNRSIKDLRRSDLVRNLPTLDDIPKCSDCDLRWICLGGCRDRSNLYYGDIYHPDPWCEFFYWFYKEMLFRTVKMVEKRGEGVITFP